MIQRPNFNPPGFHHTFCLATCKLGHTIYGYTLLGVQEPNRAQTAMNNEEKVR